MSGLLTAGEKVEVGRALADVHNWSGSAWRKFGYRSALPNFLRLTGS